MKKDTFSESSAYVLFLILYHKCIQQNNKPLLSAINSYWGTAELSMLTAADEVRNLVVSEKKWYFYVNGDSSKTNENVTLKLMIVT